MQLVGKIVRIMQPETFNTFTKQTIWIEEISGQYPQTYNIDMSGKALDYMNNYNQGDIVEVEANLRGRYWNKNGKEGVFISLSGWKIQKAGSQQASNQQGYTAPASTPVANDGHPAGFTPIDDNDSDQLPF